MTRAVSLRSSKRKPVKASQEVVPDDCKENSPSILSQNSRKASEAKKTKANTKQSNVLLNQKINFTRENLPSLLSRNSRKATVANKNSDDSKQGILETKEKNNKGKENVPPKELSEFGLSVASTEEVFSPVRKSARRVVPSGQNKHKNQIGRNVLSDRTNSPGVKQKEPCEQNVDVLKTLENKNSISHELVSIPKLNSIKNVEKSESHIPVYNTAISLKSTENPPPQCERKEAIYEFEVDENEEPAPKKRRQKRMYTRKPKIGPKALTINNIKYSSTESLASLPERRVAQKVKRNKGTSQTIKSQSLLTTLDNTTATSASTSSFTSHPPLPFHQNKPKHNLSVLQESQSEQNQSPSLHMENHDHVEPPVNYISEVRPSSNLFNAKTPHLSSSQSNSYLSPNPRCYSSGRTPNPHHEEFTATYQNMTPNIYSPCLTSTSSRSHDFLSSTPCKRASLVVRNNSVFDDSCEIPLGVRPSTGLIKDAYAIVEDLDDKCFGFDEPEELEEPLVSPIKNSIDLEPVRPIKKIPLDLKMEEDGSFKPSVQEVINMLKATLPKPATKKETTEVYKSSSDSSGPDSPTVVETERTCVFIKPARQSYERQRRVRYDSEHEEESEEEKVEKAPEGAPKDIKKCYKKTINRNKTLKAPKVTKAKQRMVKEEEELDRLAAEMNAQFQQIEKVSLVVE